MFGDEPLRPDLVAAVARTWEEISRPGSWWDGGERVAIAAASRSAWTGDEGTWDLPEGAVGAVERITVEPGTTMESWVDGITERIGEPRYVELVGVVARVIAVDTLSRLLGREAISLPEALSGSPSQDPPPGNVRRNRTWVSMAVPSPPSVLGAVPDAMAAMNDLTDELYMPVAEMGDPDWRRRTLHRTQMELVAATVSHQNECFY